MHPINSPNVQYHKRLGKYQVHIRSRGRNIYVGTFVNHTNAIIARNLALHDLRGQYPLVGWFRSKRRGRRTQLDRETKDIQDIWKDNPSPLADTPSDDTEDTLEQPPQPIEQSTSDILKRTLNHDDHLNHKELTDDGTTKRR